MVLPINRAPTEKARTAGVVIEVVKAIILRGSHAELNAAEGRNDACRIRYGACPRHCAKVSIEVIPDIKAPDAHGDKAGAQRRADGGGDAPKVSCCHR